MKRILYIHHGGGLGGAPLSLLYLLQQLDRSQYTPIVATLKAGPVVDLYRAEGIETFVEPGISDFSHTNLEWYGGGEWWRLPGKLIQILPSILRTRALVRRVKPDLVHLNSSTLGPSAVGCWLAGVPVVWHIREPLAKGTLGARRAILRRLIDRIPRRVIAISQHDADQLLASERVQVIYNFVDFETFSRELSGEGFRAEAGIPTDAPVVLMLGGVAEPKGTYDLIRALPILLERVPDAKIVIAGPPLQEANEGGLKGFAKRALRANAYHDLVRAAFNALPREMRQAVIYAGMRQDIPQVIAASQVLVFPSVVAHFARPIIEAAAMGVPSVASHLGGPRELIVDGETGRLVPARDPRALADALADLLLDRERACRMGEAAYQRARELFEAGTNARSTIAVYDQILVH